MKRRGDTLFFDPPVWVESCAAAGGTKAGTAYQLKFDPQVKAALELLGNPARYKAVLGARK